MSNKILLNLKHARLENELFNFQPFVSLAHSILHQGKGKGSEFLGWLNLPNNFNVTEFKTIQTCAQKIRNDSEALVVIGIGGSYQGAKAAIEMLSHSFHNLLPPNKRPGTEIYFAGQNISATYLNHLLELLAEKDFSINVISKSGTTTEPAIAFRLLRNLLKKKYGEKEARKRIYATTDKDKGALRKLATEEAYQTFIVPNDIGGRYSVLTPVGLLPIAAAGIDIAELMAGAKQAMIDLQDSNLEHNDCYSYAAARQLLYRKGKQIELLVSYEPAMQSLADWWKQLFGESEGKDGTGIYPSTASFSTDLHSLGQYIQDGPRHLFETIINIEQPQCNLLIPTEKDDLDGLNYLADKTIDFVNKKALQGTMLAHSNDQIPNLLLSIPEKTPFFLGYLFYFFEKACAISSYLSGVNPFDQPGVEAYKKNMFALLGKPGYETLKETLEKGLHF